MKCKNCGNHEGTKKWVGEGGYLAVSHGFYEMWCEGCVLRKQIEHAEERAKMVGTLRVQLAQWEAKHVHT